MDFLAGKGTITLSDNARIRIEGLDSGNNIISNTVSYPDGDYTLADIAFVFNTNGTNQTDGVQMAIDSTDGFIRIIANPSGNYASLYIVEIRSDDAGVESIFKELLGTFTQDSNDPHIMISDSVGLLLRWAFSINLFDRYFGSLVKREAIAKNVYMESALTAHSASSSNILVRRGYKLTFVLSGELLDKWYRFLNWNKDYGFSFELENTYEGFSETDVYDSLFENISSLTTKIDYRDIVEVKLNIYKRL